MMKMNILLGFTNFIINDIENKCRNEGKMISSSHLFITREDTCPWSICGNKLFKLSLALSQVYKVLVSVGRSEWFVFRRYAEFDKLYNTLKKQFPAMALKIPAKRIFGDNFDPDFIKQRRAGLNEFIQNLVRHPELYNHPDVRAFLPMDSPKHQSDPSEDDDERSIQKLKKQFPAMALKIPAKRIFGDNFDPVQMSEHSFQWTVQNTSQIHLKMTMKEAFRRKTQGSFVNCLHLLSSSGSLANPSVPGPSHHRLLRV
ncbi:uncharacterized protein LOC128563566 [Nycticebus coucang]|uniref:uncharacterized protein LOC128563566 n=1 Tax=Nycticebus coucang TaxID=9470 RepID=UPI00234DBA89|nr:uncharacterized protein LOC128563566 [Nycticebus coucang]